jgi:hypothetical protein
MNILCCLLSDQHVPNLLSVHHFRPDHLVLVESAAMRKRKVAAHFLTALKLGGLDYEGRHDIEPLEAEDSLEAVRRTLRVAYGKHPSASWIANLTGGTKPMSIATYEFFRALQGRLVYTNVARPAELLDIDTAHPEDCRHRLTIKEFLAGYGFESRKDDKKIAEAEERARQTWECSRVIAEHTASDDLLALDEADRKTARSSSKGWQLQPGQLRPGNEPVARSIAQTFRLTVGDGLAPTGKLSKYDAQFLTGGWLEVFMWGLIGKHADALGVWDVQLGLEVARSGDPAPNDFDVAFMHNYGLAMIECKSGAQEHDPGSDILYKVEAVTRQFRALRVKSYLATTGTNVLDREKGIKAAIANRAAIYNCRILTADDIRQLARQAEDADLVRRTLFASDERP